MTPQPEPANSTSETPPAGFCPSCGYDQRGRTPGDPCPECGKPFWHGLTASEITKWADHRIIDLHAVAILTITGALSAIIGRGATGRSGGPELLLQWTAFLYIAVATVWFAILAVLSVRRLIRMESLNLSGNRKTQLRFWLILDAAFLLAAIPLAIL